MSEKYWKLIMGAVIGFMFGFTMICLVKTKGML